MKFAKRILATLLVFALALSFALPTMAAVNWDDFRITKQPQNLTIEKGESFTLSLEVNVPDGVEVEYSWYGAGARRIENATAHNLHIDPKDSAYPSEQTYYRCKITAYEKDANNNEISSKELTSETVCVTVKDNTFGGKLYSVTLEPFVYAAMQTYYSIMASMGLIIPLCPIFFLFFLGDGIVKGFKGLF